MLKKVQGFMLSENEIDAVKSRYEIHTTQGTLPKLSSTHLHFTFTVSIDEIASVRRGRQSEGLTKHTDTTLEDFCFSIFFKDRKKNLDLMASSEEDANRWVTAIEKVISNMQNLSQRQKSEQYPSEQSQQSLKCFHLTFLHAKNKCRFPFSCIIVWCHIVLNGEGF